MDEQFMPMQQNTTQQLKGTDHMHNVGESYKHYAKKKKPDTGLCKVWFHLYKILEKEKQQW